MLENLGEGTPVMDTKDAYIRQIENQISAMHKQVDDPTGLILVMRQDKFGASSEKTPKDAVDGRLPLFGEAEVCADASVPEPVTKEGKGYFWMEDVPSQTMLRRMPSAHLRLAGRTGFFLIHQRALPPAHLYIVLLKLQKQTVSMSTFIWNICCYICRILTGKIILKIWMT